MPKLLKLEKRIKNTKDESEIKLLLEAKDLIFFEEKEELERIIGKNGFLIKAELKESPSLRRLIWKMSKSCKKFKKYKENIKQLILGLDAYFLPVNIAKKFINAIELSANINKKVFYILEQLDNNFVDQYKLLRKKDYYGYFQAIRYEKNYFSALAKISENFNNSFITLVNYEQIKKNRNLLRLAFISSLTMAHFPFIFSIGVPSGLLFAPLLTDSMLYLGSKFSSKDAKDAIRSLGSDVPPGMDIDRYVRKISVVVEKAENLLIKTLK